MMALLGGYLLGLFQGFIILIFIYLIFPRIYFYTINKKPVGRLKILWQMLLLNMVLLSFGGVFIPNNEQEQMNMEIIIAFGLGFISVIIFFIWGINKPFDIEKEEKHKNLVQKTEDDLFSQVTPAPFIEKVNGVEEAFSNQPKPILTNSIIENEKPDLIIKLDYEEKKEPSQFLHKQESIKLNNVFLGFVEGIFIDGNVNQDELEALIKWVEKYPECTQSNDFDNLMQVINGVVKNPNLLNEKYFEIINLLNVFKNNKFYVKGTADTQRLHGLLAGMVCDKNLTIEEVELLNRWLKENDHLEEDPIYIDLFEKLKPFRLTKIVDNNVVNDVLKSIQKYVDDHNFGLPVQVVTSSKDNINPDFYHGEFEIERNTFCFTGASSLYTKAEWKSAVENKGGIFTDSLTKKVQYLVICNKGNSSWAHMSYGRKFEQALKWQKDGVNLLILTEDDFVKELKK